MNDFSKAIAKSIGKATAKMEQKAVKLCPVDTGRLRNSIYAKSSNDKIKIGANTDYAEYVEYGTVKQRSQPYIRPAVQEGIDYLVDEIVKELNKSGKQ